MLIPVSSSNADAERDNRPSVPTPSESLGTAARLWRSLALVAVLFLAFALRLWYLTQNGWGNEYYTAGVLSMTNNWSNFLYNSFDPAGFVSVDKPPVALWIQVASVKLFGFHGLSVLIPQVLEGLASVWIVYHLVQRRFGATAGLLAALFFAITPVSVAIDRSSNTDSCLVLVLLLAAWALTRAVEEGGRRFLLLSMALVGLGFNVKMLAAWVVLPTFVLVYFLGAPITWRRRIKDLSLAAVVLLTASLAWVVIYDLTPAEHRPFAGTTKKNSMLELAIGPYAVGRFVPVVKRSETAQGDQQKEQASVAGTTPPNSRGNPAEARIRNSLARLFVRAPAGPLRLADGQMAGQVGWLVPLAVMGLVLGAFRGRFYRPMSPAHLSLLLWFGWAVTYGVVYSFAGGISHLYYLATMAPPLAALAAIGVVNLWDRYHQKGWGVVLLPTALLLTAGWQLYVQASALDWKLGETASSIAAITALGARYGDWQTWLYVAFLGGTLITAGGLLIIGLCRAWSRPSRTLAAAALGVGLLALLVLPLAWALSSVLVPGHGVLPSADMARLVRVDGNASAAVRRLSAESMATSKLVGFLKANRRGERYLLSTATTRLAAPIIISTGEAVMARGGFHGLDPILSTEKLARMIETNQVRFVMLGYISVISRILGAEAAGRPIDEWVQANGRLVDSSLWRSSGRERGGLRLYDLRPDAPLMPAP
jgi:4-amino-4-deoxy-L-arabinose transferase-like glycosyltransferase